MGQERTTRLHSPERIRNRVAVEAMFGSKGAFTAWQAGGGVLGLPLLGAGGINCLGSSRRCREWDHRRAPVYRPGKPRRWCATNPTS